MLEAAFVAVTLLLAAALLIVLAHRLWFFGDDWAFALGRHHSLTGRGGFLEPHNEHWSTVPLVAFRVVHLLFGTAHYLPYAALPIVAHLVICGGLYVLLRRSGVVPVPAGLAMLVLAFYGGGAEDTLWAFQIGFLATAAFVVLALVVDSLALPPPVRIAVVVVLLLLAVMSSGMAIPLVGWAGLAVLLRRGWLQALTVVALPAVVYVLWRLAFSGDMPKTTPRAPAGLIMPFAGKGLAGIWAAATATESLGGPILVALLLLALTIVVSREARALAVGGMIACIGLFVTLGVSRGGYGLEGAAASRYLYMGMLLTLPAFAVALQRLWVAMPWPLLPTALVWGVLAAFLVACGVTSTIDYSEQRGRAIDEASVRLAAGQALARRADTLSETPDPLTSPDVDLPDLHQPGIRDFLHNVHYDSFDVLQARGLMQVRVTTKRPTSSYTPSTQVVARSAAGLEAVTGHPGCFHGYAVRGTALNFRGGRPGHWVQVRTDATVVSTGVASGSRATDVRVWGVHPGRAVYVVSGAVGYRTRVLLSPGAFTYCESPSSTSNPVGAQVPTRAATPKPAQ